MQEIVGLCSRFGLGKVTNGRLPGVLLGQSRPDGPECWDKIVGALAGHGSATAANDSERTLGLQVLPEQAQASIGRARSSHWRDAECNVRIG